MKIHTRSRSPWSLCSSVVEHWSAEIRRSEVQSSWELRIFSLCHARGKTKKRLIISLLRSQTKLVGTLHQSNVCEVLSLSPTFKCCWLPSSRPILRKAGRGGYYMCQQMCLGLQIAWRILLFFWSSCFRPVFGFRLSFCYFSKRKRSLVSSKRKYLLWFSDWSLLITGGGEGVRGFWFIIAIKWPDSLIRLCSIVMIPPHWQVISSQFLSPPSLHTLLATTDPPPFPF